MARGVKKGSIPYLITIREIWHYERRIDPRLGIRWDGKPVGARLRLSLGTRDKAEAMVPYCAVHLKVEKMIADAEKIARPKPKRIGEMDVHQLIAVVRDMPVAEGRYWGDMVHQYEQQHYVEFTPEARQALKWQIRAQAFAMDTVERLGVKDDAPAAPAAVSAPVAPPVQVLPPLSMTLENLIKVYWDAPENRNKEETKKNAKACYALLLEVFGKDKAANDVTRADFRWFQKICLNLPPLNWRRKLPKGYEQFKDLSVTDAAELAEELNADLEDENRIPGLNPNSVNKYMSALQQLFRFAEGEGICNDNHTLGLRVPRQKSNKGGFSVDQLRILFPADYNLTDPKHWVPLIALYHGCRGNEIAQLDTADVADVEGLPCFFFTANVVVDGVKTNKASPVKSIKQLVSDRRIPVHPKLVELGFLKYVQSRRDNKKEKLFDYNRYGDSYWEHARKYLGYDWLEKVKDETVSFHSFRHTFKNACRGMKFLNINPRFVSELGGWTRGKGAEEGYGEYSPPATLLEVLKLVQYPVDL